MSMIATELERRVTQLEPLDVSARAQRLRQLFAGAGVDALVVTSSTNIRYLTGFTGSAGVVVITDSDMALITDGRYRDQAADQVRGS